MTEIERLKTLIDMPSGDNTKDGFLSLLLEQARSYALSYCRLDFADEAMLPVIVRMAAEDFGRAGGEGLSFRSVSGASESYRGDYSPQIMSQLRRFRRIGGPSC